MLMQHNIPVYENLVETIKKHNKAIIVTTMGTGKSYLVKEYLENNNLNALVVCPTRAICQNWKQLSNRVTSITYAAFQKRDYPGYDCYVFDEAHHSGSEKWGKAISTFMSKTSKPVIGLTADPVRYSDNGKNVADDLWGGAVVKGYTMGDAIELGILPAVTYVYSLFGIDKIYESYKNKAAEKEESGLCEKLLSKFEFSIKNVEKIEDIIRKYAPDKAPKGVIFADKVSSLPDAVNTVKKAYPDLKYWLINSYKRNKSNFDALKEFNESESGFIVSVDMLNEGLHVEGVNTVIMFRKTQSPTVYFQQMGRAMSASGKDSIVLFDFVGNKENVKSAVNHKGKGLLETALSDSCFNQTFATSKGDIPPQVIVKDCTGDICNICNEIDAVLSDKWTLAEDEILYRYYPGEGTSVSKRLPNRTSAACRARALLLGIKNESRCLWDEENDEILRRYYPTEGSAVSKRLTNGAEGTSIGSRAHILGIKCDKTFWSEEDLNFLKENYEKLGPKGVAEKIGKTPTACQSKARRLHLKKDMNLWTEQEIAILKEHYPTMGGSVCELLPGKTRDSCINKASTLKIPAKKFHWTDEYDRFIKENYGVLNCSQMAEKLTKMNGEYVISRDKVQKRVSRLGLAKRAASEWSEDDLNFLKNNYKKISATEIAKRLNRTYRSVYSKAASLGLQGQ